MTTNYEKVRALRNRMLPERCKPEFGCEVFIPGEDNFSNRGKRGKGILTKSYVGRDYSWSGYDATNDRVSVYMTEGDVYRPAIGIAKNKIKILGQPLDISDVLRMLGALEKKNGGQMITGIR